MGTPSGMSGSDGMSGRNGWDGSSGKAGSITVTFNPQAERYLGALRFFNRDGSRQSGPLPILQAAPTAPLW
jgi:hypothetical protein